MPHTPHQGPEVRDRCPDTIALRISGTLQAGLAFRFLLPNFEDPRENLGKLGKIVAARAARLDTIDPPIEFVISRKRASDAERRIGEAIKQIPGTIGDVLKPVQSAFEIFHSDSKSDSKES